ncbi:hypothetical protein PIB30_004478 [Stylosanthes scabra]|uniref:Uncharacterized protein n=1 Tax=Stylosanthes scabra TaxID=79078 RepID=A0ABU6W775_9FABA|nr:hypothetical protein [Stylosanthes scabra]
MEAASSIIKKKPNNDGVPLNHDSKEAKLEDLESSGTETEMKKMKNRVSYSYTSLRDIMPVLQNNNRNSNNGNTASWNEISVNIKNPLLKQAAMSYLQPMSTSSDSIIPNRGFFHNLFGCFGCFGCICSSLFHDGGEEKEDNVDS